MLLLSEVLFDPDLYPSEQVVELLELEGELVRFHLPLQEVSEDQLCFLDFDVMEDLVD